MKKSQSSGIRTSSTEERSEDSKVAFGHDGRPDAPLLLIKCLEEPA